MQHELVVKHREGQDHIASDFLIAEHRKVTASFRAEPIQAEREQEGFLRVPPFQGERQGQLLPRGRMAPCQECSSRSARPEHKPNNIATGSADFWRLAMSNRPKRRALAVCSMPSGPVALGGARTTVSALALVSDTLKRASASLP